MSTYKPYKLLLMQSDCIKFKQTYTLIAFDERVIFWLQRAGSLPCACVFAALYACAIAQWLYSSLYVQIMQHTNTHKAVTGRAEAKKLPSRRRQSNYRSCGPFGLHSHPSLTVHFKMACGLSITPRKWAGLCLGITVYAGPLFYKLKMSHNNNFLHQC